MCIRDRKQIERTVHALKDHTAHNTTSQLVWCEQALHYRELLCKIIHQTQQRVYDNVSVSASDKILSVFEPHTDIIVKGARDVQYGHKINLATDTQGLVLYLAILDGNPGDAYFGDGDRPFRSS